MSVFSQVSNTIQNLFNTQQPEPDKTYITILTKRSEVITDRPQWNVAIVYRHPHRTDLYTLTRACSPITISKQASVLDAIYMAMDSLVIFGNPSKNIVFSITDAGIKDAFVTGKVNDQNVPSYLHEKFQIVKETLAIYPGNILFADKSPYPADLTKALIAITGL